MSPVAIIARAIIAGGLAGARPLLTLLLVQVAVGFFTDGSGVPEGLEWLVHTYAIAIVAALAVVEHFARTDPDLDELLQVPSVVVTLVIAATLPLLLPALDSEPRLPWEDRPTGDEASSSGLVTAKAGMPDGLFGLEGLKLIAAVVMALALFWTRRQVMRAFGALSLSQRYLRWAESGVIVGAFAVLALLPALTVALAVLVMVGSAVTGVSLWTFQRRRDDEARRPCPQCEARIRKEALRCPKCGAEVEPRRRLES
jgi:hypothetical protein